jgi:hypothetical protein
MTISAIELAYLPQHDQSALLDWISNHWQFHTRIAQRAVRDGHTNLGTYDVSQMADRDDWLYFHQQDHIEISQTYNLAAPPDLTYWDEKDPDNFNNWLQAHALTHDGINKGLGFV